MKSITQGVIAIGAAGLLGIAAGLGWETRWFQETISGNVVQSSVARITRDVYACEACIDVFADEPGYVSVSTEQRAQVYTIDIAPSHLTDGSRPVIIPRGSHVIQERDVLPLESRTFMFDLHGQKGPLLVFIGQYQGNVVDWRALSMRIPNFCSE